MQLEALGLPSQKPTLTCFALLTMIRIHISRNWLEALNSFPHGQKNQQIEIYLDSEVVWYLISNPMCLYSFYSAVNSP